MMDPAPDPSGRSSLGAEAAALDRILREAVQLRAAARESGDERTRRIAEAAAIHSYLMAQRLLGPVA